MRMSDTVPSDEKQAPSEMVERVARAICLHRGIDPNGRESLLIPGEGARGVFGWQMYAAEAAVAIIAHVTALDKAGYAIVPQEPTEAMVDHGQGALDYTPIFRCEAQAIKVWRAMVGAALGGKP